MNILPFYVLAAAASLLDSFERDVHHNPGSAVGRRHMRSQDLSDHGRTLGCLEPSSVSGHDAEENISIPIGLRSKRGTVDETASSQR